MASGISFSQGNDIFYLQAGSFKNKNSALQLEKRLSTLSKSVVVRRKMIKDMGRWYRVYIGPFQEKKEALTKGEELRKKGIFKGRSIVLKKTEFLRTNLDQNPVGKMPASAAQHFSGTADSITPEQLKIAPIPEILILPLPPPPSTIHLLSPPDPVEKMNTTGKPTVAITTTEPQKSEQTYVGKDEGPMSREHHKMKEGTIGDQAEDELSRRGKNTVGEKPSTWRVQEKKSIPSLVPVAIPQGRNILGGTFSVAFNHTWSKIQTNLIHRTRVLSDGETTVNESVSPDTTEKDDISTYMESDTIQFRYGLWDFMEVRAEAGVAYADFSNTNFSYGAGLRFKLLDRSYNDRFNFYGALQGDYLAGTLEDEYVSDAGDPWQKETDWQMFNTGLEFGVVFPLVTIYAGGTYFIYYEDTIRSLMGELPSPLTSFTYEDEIIEENRLGVFGGIMLHITPKFFLNLETHFINHDSVTLAIEYQF